MQSRKQECKKNPEHFHFSVGGRVTGLSIIAVAVSAIAASIVSVLLKIHQHFSERIISFSFTCRCTYQVGAWFLKVENVQSCWENRLQYQGKYQHSKTQKKCKALFGQDFVWTMDFGILYLDLGLGLVLYHTHLGTQFFTCLPSSGILEQTQPPPSPLAFPKVYLLSFTL